MEYSKLAYYAALFANDLKHIYIHAAGPNLNEIRSDAESLYFKAMRDFEDLSKLAIINNEKVGNMNTIRSYVPDTEWKAIELDAVDFNDFAMYVSINGQQYLNALKNIDNKDRDSEDRIAYWEDAVTYDNGQRLALNNGSVEDSKGPVPENPNPKEFNLHTNVNPLLSGNQDAVVIAVPDWRSLGASSALSQSVLNR